MKPTDLHARREEKLAYGVCTTCPSPYFKVQVVTLRPDSVASGYSGIPVCAGCETLRIGGFPEGLPMPCGGCGLMLTLPDDTDHRCADQIEGIR